MNIIKKIKDRITKRYTKYDGGHPIHWLWYEDKNHWYTKLVDKSLSFFNEKGTVLDLGSGDGLVDSLFVQKGFIVTGIEPEIDGINISRNRVKARFLHTTLKEFAKFPPHSLDIKFDYLYSLNTIEHLKEYNLLPEFIKNRVNKFAVIITDNAEKSSANGRFHNKEFTITELQELFKDFQTEVLDLENDNFIGIKIII